MLPCLVSPRGHGGNDNDNACPTSLTRTIHCAEAASLRTRSAARTRAALPTSPTSPTPLEEVSRASDARLFALTARALTHARRRTLLPVCTHIRRTTRRRTSWVTRAAPRRSRTTTSRSCTLRRPPLPAPRTATTLPRQALRGRRCAAALATELQHPPSRARAQRGVAMRTATATATSTRTRAACLLGRRQPRTGCRCTRVDVRGAAACAGHARTCSATNMRVCALCALRASAGGDEEEEEDGGPGASPWHCAAGAHHSTHTCAPHAPPPDDLPSVIDASGPPLLPRPSRRASDGSVRRRARLQLLALLLTRNPASTDHCVERVHGAYSRAVGGGHGAALSARRAAARRSNGHSDPGASVERAPHVLASTPRRRIAAEDRPRRQRVRCNERCARGLRRWVADA